jgi:DNA-binding LytR/AlgR family response regulator
MDYLLKPFDHDRFLRAMAKVRTWLGHNRQVDAARFRRVHRSHIVNLDHVAKLLPWFGGDSLLMMTDGTRLTLSRVYRDHALREWRGKP